MKIWLFALLLVPFSACLDVQGEQGNGAIDAAALRQGWAAGDARAKVIHEAGGGPMAIIQAEPLVVDLDGDGRDEIVVHGRDRTVRVFDLSGTLLGSIPVTYPPSWHVDAALNPVAAGRLDGQSMALVVASPAAVITAWTVTPGKTWTFERAWEARGDGCRTGAGMDAPAVLADLDGKPGLEVIVQTEQVGLLVFSHTGQLLWKHCWAGGNAGPAVGDLDGDGRLEVVFASDSGFIAVMDGATGAPLWTFDVAPFGIAPASIVTSPTIADLDGRGQKEVLFTARHAPVDDPSRFEDFHMAIVAVHQNADYEAELLWLRQPAWAHAMSNTRLIVDDVDGDGRADIFGMDWNTIGHHPGDWEPFETTHIFRLDAQGDDVWVRELTAWWSNKPVFVADVDGDGDRELVVSTPRGESDGLWRINTADGKPEGFLTAGHWTVTAGPVRTSTGEIVAAAYNQSEQRASVLIYSVGAP